MLTENDLAHLRYLTSLIQQPANSWDGFYRTPADGMNFGLRFQLAFPVYALYALAQQTPAYLTPYATAINSYIEKMLRPEVWGYWFNGVIRSQEKKAQMNVTQSSVGQPSVAGQAILQVVVDKTHSSLGIAGSEPLSPDPCRTGNIQYSGHLCSMLGFYALLSGDNAYNNAGFDLAAEANGQGYVYQYSHTTLAERIYEQMRQNYFSGVCCEPGRAYAACNNHACISNLLYDKLHATNFGAVNANWANWVETKMLRDKNLPLPTPNGLLSVAYMPQVHLPIPVSFNFTDAWGFAFMAAWQPELVERVYPRFRKRLKPTRQGLKLASAGLNTNFEISNEGLNTAFALVLAQTMGDNVTATALRQHLDATLSPTANDNPAGRFYQAAQPTPYVTALVALAEALPKGGLYQLMQWQPQRQRPHFANIAPNIAVKQADWLANSDNLTLEVAQTARQPLTIELAECPNLPAQVIIDGSELAADQIHYNPANRHLTITPAQLTANLQVIF